MGVFLTLPQKKKYMNKVQEILEEILVTNDLSIWQLSKKLKVPYMTVYHWIKHAQNSKVGIC